MSLHEITLKVNGKTHKLVVKSNELLLNVLRDRLYLTGTKYGCGLAECGACTILNGDRSIMSCLVPAVVADGWEITTSEGLADGDKLSPVQEEFINQGAIQCGFCTPGMVVTSTALLRENPDPDEDFIRNYLRGNYCRCTGYAAMIKAVQVAAQRMKEEKNE
ncbi:MAG TPA: (2Fe-2S)-binding protein [Flexilinea sp.]|jgi:carbon-monoxide dehydrogenase small subunit|nr:(2Fe-2S)-binding protein [Flexilinea sp.]OQA28929.1 MAG: Carbon monoxide dehydrogenase small chain [Chloroflexi bacterium ADurb.Bin344]HNY94240.1 (2Fe-2S)-binding protein [Flexilinea sp.]HOG21121.1 (2Fe-2S)-binding protein [Flexilinea sp.]HOG60113.1 (2Fe-2S)-binding protein [Flexilinea sp.]